MNLPKSKLVKKQVRTEVRTIGKKRVEVEIRYDDSCGNGHNSFGIIGEVFRLSRSGIWKWEAGGQVTEDIVTFFPWLKPYMKWHLCSSDGPMHYVSNALYHANTKDCWGLEKGEKRQIVNGRSKLPAWELVAINKETGEEVPLHSLKKNIDSETKPECEYTIEYRPWCKVGEGSEANLEAARQAAIWPEAQLEDFTEEKLLARLPTLMEEFKAAMESLGFEY